MAPLQRNVDILSIFSNVAQIREVNTRILADFENYASGRAQENVGMIFLKYVTSYLVYNLALLTYATDF